MTIASSALPLSPGSSARALCFDDLADWSEDGRMRAWSPRRGRLCREGVPVSGRVKSVPFVSQRPEEERSANDLSSKKSARSISRVGLASGIAALSGIALIAYGAGQIDGASALAGLLLLSPVLVGAAVAKMAGHRFNRPLAAVAHAVTRLSAGERTVRVDAVGDVPELAELIHSVNRMATAMDSQDKERLLLTAGITHELRTPLTILQGRLHGIEDGVIQPEAGEAERLLRQVRHILHIVDDLDTLVKVDAGRLLLTREVVDLEAICRPAVDDLEALTEPHGVRFLQDYEPVALIGDPVRITQILTNLITNAAKHSPVGGEIIVQVRAIGDKAVIDVIDQGPGLAASDRDHLFTPYWRSSASRRIGCPGSGMGLALTARLVHAHGGHIVGDNRRDRSGARFSVSLPLGYSA